MATNNEPIETTALEVSRTVHSQTGMTRANVDDFMPLLSVEQAVQRKDMINAFIGKVLKEGAEAGEGDFGIMPGTTKKVLFKPGAEKLCSIFGLAPQYIEDKIIEDWTGKEHGGEQLFYYSYRCQLTRGGNFMGEAIGSANTWESKYRYRWVGEESVPNHLEPDHLPQRGGKKTIFEPDFAIDKRETTGQYGKPAEYWASFEDAIAARTAKRVTKKLGKREFEGYEMVIDQKQYRIANPDVADTINAIQKIAQKRALVAAVLVVTNASDSFTQDMEDFSTDGATTHRKTEGGAKDQQTNGNAPQGGGAQQAAKPPAAPAELVGIFARIERTPQLGFEEGAKIMEQALVQKFGAEEGLKRYDSVADTFYERHPKGTTDVAELKRVLLALYAELERPVAQEDGTVSDAAGVKW